MVCCLQLPSGNRGDQRSVPRRTIPENQSLFCDECRPDGSIMHRMIPTEEIVTLIHFLEGCAMLKVWDGFSHDQQSRCLATYGSADRMRALSWLCFVLQVLPTLPTPDSVMPLREDVLLGGPRHLTAGEVLGSVASHELIR